MVLKYAYHLQIQVHPLINCLVQKNIISSSVFRLSILVCCLFSPFLLKVACCNSMLVFAASTPLRWRFSMSAKILCTKIGRGTDLGPEFGYVCRSVCLFNCSIYIVQNNYRCRLHLNPTPKEKAKKSKIPKYMSIYSFNYIREMSKLIKPGTISQRVHQTIQDRNRTLQQTT